VTRLLSDPPEMSVIVPAARWVEAMLTGNLATTIAIIGVAAIGFSMLAGRIDVRKGGRVLLGCFILFGAATLAAGLQRAAQSPAAEVTISAPVPPPIFAQPKQTDAANPYDPYAGASVPQQ
jgi:type IV secretory pathway VirB2 component (pilin)